jgi:hypothetical protein
MAKAQHGEAHDQAIDQLARLPGGDDADRDGERHRDEQRSRA